MRALKYTNSGLLLDSKAPEPVGQPGHAIIRPARLGVHPIDLAIARGWTTYSGILGRECIGLVESVQGTPEESSRWMGKRVLLQAALPCGACAQCRGGSGAHCVERRVAGLSGREGFFADRICAPVNSLIEVPKAIGDDLAILAYAMADAVHTTQVVRAEGKTYVTVLGDTLDALLVARVLAARNTTVRLLCRSQQVLMLCEKWGIRARPIFEAGLRHDQSIVVDCSEAAGSVDHAVQMLRPRGTLILRSAYSAVPLRGWAAESQRPQAVVKVESLVAKEITLIGTRSGTLAEGLDLVSKTGTDLLPVITRRFKLADGAHALKAAAEPEQLKVVLEL